MAKPNWEHRFDDVLAIVGLADNRATPAIRVRHDLVMVHLREAIVDAITDARATSRRAALVLAIQHTCRTKDPTVVRRRLAEQIKTDEYRRTHP